MSDEANQLKNTFDLKKEEEEEYIDDFFNLLIAFV